MVTEQNEYVGRFAAVDAVEVRDLGTDLTDAAVLLRSQGAAAAGRELEVLVLSDGAFPDPGGLEGLRVSYVPFGEAADNQGIADLRVVRGSAGEVSLLVSAEAFGAAPLKRTLSLRLAGDGRVLDGRSAEAARRPLGQEGAQDRGEEPGEGELPGRSPASP